MKNINKPTSDQTDSITGSQPRVVTPGRNQNNDPTTNPYNVLASETESEGEIIAEEAFLPTRLALEHSDSESKSDIDSKMGEMTTDNRSTTVTKACLQEIIACRKRNLT